MKFFAMISLMSVAFAASAQDFEKVKAHQIKGLDKDIANTTAAKTCMTAAKNFEDINKCYNALDQKVKAKQAEDQEFFKTQVPAQQPAKK